MDIQQLRAQIELSFVKCVEPGCGEIVDSWPDADPSEPGHSIVYLPREAIFVGMCGRGHASEFYLKEVKAGEVEPHLPTERTLGRPVSQKDCVHAKRQGIKVPDGMSIATEEGIVAGPVDLMMCAYCACRWRPGE